MNMKMTQRLSGNLIQAITRHHRLLLAGLVLTLCGLASSNAVDLLARWNSRDATRQTAPASDARLDQPLSDKNAQAKARAKLAQLPLSFEANRGQTDPAVKFIAHAPGYQLFLTANEAVMALRKPAPKTRKFARPGATREEMLARLGETKDEVIRLRLAGAHENPVVAGLEEQPGKTNYYRGTDPKRWQTGVPSFGRVRYNGVYKGVDLVYYGNQRQLEYDFIVAPGADPRQIKLDLTGVASLRIDENGELVMKTPAGEVRQRKPELYQQAGGKRQTVKGRYTLTGARQVGFVVEDYDPSRELVIDPTLIYSTYFGGAGDDFVQDLVINTAGEAYLTGYTFSPNYPAAPAPVPANLPDVFVTKFNAAGSATVYSTVFGGGGFDFSNSLKLNMAGAVVFVVGRAEAGFPTTAGAYQTTFGGVSKPFLTRLDSAGALSYSTYLAGTGAGEGVASDLFLDATSRANIVGYTNSTTMPTTAGAYQTANDGGFDAFALRLNPAGGGAADLQFASYLGGAGDDFAARVYRNGAQFVLTGRTQSANFDLRVSSPLPYDSTYGGGTCAGWPCSDGFLTRLNPGGGGTADLLYSTYLGGSKDDTPFDLVGLSGGATMVVGATNSSDHPTTGTAYQTTPGGGSCSGEPCYDGFATVINTNTSGPAGLTYSTLLGGSGNDGILRVASDLAGYQYLAGTTDSANFPLINPLDSTLTGSEAFVARLTTSLAGASGLRFSTFFGGGGNDYLFGLQLDALGAVYLAGYTDSTNLPTANPLQMANAGQQDGFLLKFKPDACPVITINPATLPNGSVGAPYSQTFTAAGGPAPYRFVLSNSTAPAGLTLNTAGLLSGIPTASGTYIFTVVAGDANACAVLRNYTLQIGLTINPPVLPTGLAGAPYSQTLTATGGSAPYSFTAAGLPGWLSLTTGGALTGTPPASGSFTFTVTATDAASATGARTYTLAIYPAAANIIVTTAVDENNTNPGACSLREAILVANGSPGSGCVGALPGPDRIVFAGAYSITVTGVFALPAITEPLWIDGAPLNLAAPRVELIGPVGSNGLNFAATAGHSITRSLVIRQFSGMGINLQANSNNHVIENCYLGTDATGMSAQANNIGIAASSAYNRIGGTAPGQGNVISGNTLNGVQTAAVGNLIQGNYIGVKATGNAALPNGVAVSLGGRGHVIGGATAGARNVISGNNFFGLTLSSQNIVQGNYIGVGADGATALGNGVTGVLVTSTSLDNRIGGSGAGEGNLIAFNGNVTPTGGILLQSVPFNYGQNNSLLGNSIHSNFGPGIDLSEGSGLGNGVSANDAGDADVGPNKQQNFPALSAAVVYAGSTVIDWSLDSAPNATFTLEFFSNSACDPSGHGEGQNFIGRISVMTNGSGLASGSLSPPGAVPVGSFITATATDADGNTSEFSACRLALARPTISPVAVTRTQGAGSSNSQIATVNDVDQAANTLAVTVSSDGVTFGATATRNGVTVSNLTVDAMGIVKANVVATCTATAASLTLKVTDSTSIMATATLDVAVNANTPPVLSYTNPAALVFGNGTTVNPATGPSDNGTVNTIAVQSQGTFTGTVMVNAMGVVTISNAAPVGTHTITIRATDNCGGAGGMTDASFSLTVNKADTVTTLAATPNPAIIGQPVTFTATVTTQPPGSGIPTGTVQFFDNGNPLGNPVPLQAAAFTGEIPSASQARRAVRTLTGNTATASITISSLTAGVHNITALYQGGSSSSQSSGVLTAGQTINNVTSRLADPLVCTGPGNVLSATTTISNPSNATQTVSFTASPAVAGQAFIIDGSCQAQGQLSGTCANTITQVTFNGQLAAGQTVTLLYRVQVGDNVLPGTQVCINFGASFNGGPQQMAQVCVPLNCPPAGPGALPNTQNQLSDQKPGSVLLYPIFTSEAANAAAQNTRLAVTNTHSTLAVYLHLFFVDGANCSVADGFMCLTPNQTATMLAVDLDPGTTGYLVAVATDRSGCPINFNYLIGDEFVKFTSGHAANLAAESSAAIAGGLPACDANAVEAQLKFDGLSYNALPRALAASNLPSRGDGNDTLLIVDRIGGHLGTGASTIGTLIGVLYDDAEHPFSFSLAAPACQSRGSLTNDRPRTTPRYDQLIPPGRTGWLKIYGGTDVAIIGAQINRNASALTNANAFNQGHNLHKLTLTTTASVTIPVFPPTC